MEADDLYKTVVAQNMSAVACGRRLKEPFNFIDAINTIYGIKKVDTRSAADIIESTAKSFGVKIVR